MRIRLFLLLSGFLFSGLAMAENGCPYGESPIGGRSAGNPLGCVPNPQAQELRAPPSQPAPPRGHWETRWGAIAIGSGETGDGIGLVRNKRSKQEAQQSAMSQCHASGGGRECRISIAYYNQCAVIAWGDKGYAAQGAESLEIASNLAMTKCKLGNKNCKIIYTDCTDAKWVSY